MRAAAGTAVVAEVEETALVGRPAGRRAAVRWAAVESAVAREAVKEGVGWAEERAVVALVEVATVVVEMEEETEAETATRVGTGSDRDLRILSRCSERRAREILKWLPALE